MTSPRWPNWSRWLGVHLRGLGAGRAALADFDNDVAELIRIDQSPLGVDRVLELLSRRHRRLADLSGRHLNVLLGNGVDNIGRCQTERRQFVGIEPGTHTVIALAEVADARHSRQPAQLIADFDGGVVAQIASVIAAVRRVEVDDHQPAGQHLLDVDAFTLHQGGNDRHRQRHAVLHQHLCHVRVHAELERHGQ